MMKGLKSAFAYMVRMLFTSPSRFSYDIRIPRIMKRFRDDRTGRIVLDAGCGDGRYAKLFRGKRYVGIDIGGYRFSPPAGEDISFCTASVESIPFQDETFDETFSSFVLEHVTSVSSTLSALYRVLKPGGTLVLSTGTKYAAAVGEMHRLFWKDTDESVGQAHRYFVVDRLVELHRQAGFTDIRAVTIGGPVALFLELITTFLRLLSSKLKGGTYTHARTSDEAEADEAAKRRTKHGMLWKLVMSLLFVPRWFLHVFSFIIDLVLLPLGVSKFVVITARK
jgi:ubiquinone/menaquinone biosynthesis C-methylase UbiE